MVELQPGAALRAGDRCKFHDVAFLDEVFARPLLRDVFGGKYSSATASLRVLAVASVVTAATMVLAQVHAALSPGRLAKVWLIALVANVGLNLVLIPRYAAAGAAWATLVCQLAVAVILVTDTRRLAAAPTPSELARTATL